MVTHRRLQKSFLILAPLLFAASSAYSALPCRLIHVKRLTKQEKNAALALVPVLPDRIITERPSEDILEPMKVNLTQPIYITAKRSLMTEVAPKIRDVYLQLFREQFNTAFQKVRTTVHQQLLSTGVEPNLADHLSRSVAEMAPVLAKEKLAVDRLTENDNIRASDLKAKLTTHFKKQILPVLKQDPKWESLGHRLQDAKLDEEITKRIANATEADRQAAGVTGNFAPSDIEFRVMSKLINNVFEHWRLETEKRLDPIADEGVGIMVKWQFAKSPDWNAYSKAANESLADLKLALESIEVVKGVKVDMGAMRPDQIRNYSRQHTMPEYKMLKNGYWGLQLGDVDAYYNPHLKTLELAQINKYAAAPNEILLELNHGRSTIRSTAVSWTKLIPLFSSQGFYSVARNLTSTGVAPKVKNNEELAIYMQKKNQMTKAEFGKKGQPLTVMGRSMGSTEEIVNDYHSFMRGDEIGDGAVAKFLTSLSVPDTMEDQFANVQRQVASGAIEGIVQDSLPEIFRIANDLRSDVYGHDADPKIQARKNAFRREYGDHILLLQGSADADGGANAIRDLRAWRKNAAPLSHMVELENNILIRAEQKFPTNTPDASLNESNRQSREKIFQALADTDPNNVEASHYLISTKHMHNVEAVKAELIAKGVPESVVEKLDLTKEDGVDFRLQRFYVVSLMNGHLDYLRNSPSTQTRVAYSRKVLDQFAQQNLGEFKSYFERGISIERLTMEEVLKAQPTDRTYAGVARKALDYWETEKVKNQQQLKELGFLADYGKKEQKR